MEICTVTQHTTSETSTSRRSVLQAGSAVALATTLGSLAAPRMVHAASGDKIRVGLVGCGGRGTGAAGNALTADPGVVIVAVGDAFEDRAKSSVANLKKNANYGDRVLVTPETTFVGFDAYKQVLASGVDVVILATPPHFRPMQLEACVEAGVHTFVEKPVAVDAKGVRRVLAACKQAEEKGLTVVSGLCYRYHIPMRETVQKIHDGAIGRVVAVESIYNAGGLWHVPRKPEMTDMEWQLRNWLYFTWLSGDHNNEQHIHSLDKAAWVLGGYPKVCYGTGGRQQRTDPAYGHIYDHHAVAYEYDNGARVFSHCRQMNGTSYNTADHILGTTGVADLMRQTISGDEKWRYRGPGGDMYVQEHRELFAAIRNGQPINNGEYMANSTLMAIMGRLATYTGKTVTWEQALNSQEDLSPPAYEWDVTLPVPPVAVPGQTPLV